MTIEYSSLRKPNFFLTHSFRTTPEFKSLARGLICANYEKYSIVIQHTSVLTIFCEELLIREVATRVKAKHHSSFWHPPTTLHRVTPQNLTIVY
jgi:hypothetical protein